MLHNLLSYFRGKGADNNANSQKCGEGKDIFNMGNAKGKIGRDKEKVKNQDTYNRSYDGGASAPADSYKDDSQEIKHNDVDRADFIFNQFSKEGSKKDQPAAYKIG